MVDRNQIQTYLQQKVNPILQQVLINVVKTRPKNFLNYLKQWVQKKSQTMDQQQQQSDDDEIQQHNNRLNILKTNKCSNRWYQRRRGICGQVFGNHNFWESFEFPQNNRKSCITSRILFLLRSIFLFKQLDDFQINKLISTTTQSHYQKGEIIFKQKDIGEELFVVQSGELELTKYIQGHQQVIKIFKEGDMFGQMGILYNLPRWGTVRATKLSVLFKLNKKAYHSIMNERNLKKRKIFLNSVNKVDVLRQLDQEQRYKVQDILRQVPVHLNQYIIRQQKINKTLYIIESGKFMSLKKQKNGHDKVTNYLKQGDVFGQNCFFTKSNSTESVLSLTNGRLLAIDKDGLQRVIGPIKKIMQRSVALYEKYRTITSNSEQ